MLPKTAEYALRAVACLALKTDEAQPADVLAEQTQVPRRYLHTVLQDLVQAGLVQSRSGPGGGYVLLADADSLAILDVINAVSPLERIERCPLGLTSHIELCPLHKELDRVYAATQAALAGVTIAQILHSGGAIIPLCDVPKSPTVAGVSDSSC